MFPRYQVGDIVKEITRTMRGQGDYHYLILEKKYSSPRDNTADLYVALCLDTGIIEDRLFNETLYHTFEKVA